MSRRSSFFGIARWLPNFFGLDYAYPVATGYKDVLFMPKVRKIRVEPSEGYSQESGSELGHVRRKRMNSTLPCRTSIVTVVVRRSVWIYCSAAPS